MARSNLLLVWTLLTACAAAPRTPDLYDLLPTPREAGTYLVLAEAADIDVRVIDVWDRKKSVGTRRIQTRVRELRDWASERSIWIVSTIHLAEGAYWKAIEPLLAPAEFVLSEGVKAAVGDREEGSRELIYLMQERAAHAELTGWVMQSKWEAAIRDSRWIHADLTLEEFRALGDDRLDAKKTGEWELYLERMERLIDGDTVLGHTRATVRNPLRQKWVRAIEGSVRDGSLRMPDPFDAANEERDRRAVERMLAELKKPSHKPLVVLYGALHTAKFVKALYSHSIVETRASRWLDACSAEIPLALFRGLRPHQHQPDGAD